MIKRAISTVVLWAAIALLLYAFKAPAGAFLIVLLAAATQYELYRLLEKCDMRPFKSVGIAVGVLFLTAAYFFPQWAGTAFYYSGTERHDGFNGLALALVVIAISALAPKIPNRVATLAATALGFIYVPYLFHYFIQILHLGYDQVSGVFLAVWVVVVVKFTDVGAYVVGSMIGRHKMAPKISPGKTWEGVLGGIVVSALCGAGYVALFGEHLPVIIGPLAAAFLAVPIAIVSVGSDLLESAIKRQANVKDSGDTIPGIGGAFDLTDSLLLSVPVAYALLLLFV